MPGTLAVAECVHGTAAAAARDHDVGAGVDPLDEETALDEVLRPFASTLSLTASPLDPSQRRPVLPLGSLGQPPPPVDALDDASLLVLLQDRTITFSSDRRSLSARSCAVTGVIASSVRSPSGASSNLPRLSVFPGRPQSP